MIGGKFQSQWRKSTSYIRGKLPLQYGIYLMKQCCIKGIRPQIQDNCISFVERKTEPLGEYFINLLCSKTVFIVFLDIYRSRDTILSLEHVDLNPISAGSLCIT